MVEDDGHRHSRTPGDLKKANPERWGDIEAYPEADEVVALHQDAFGALEKGDDEKGRISRISTKSSFNPGPPPDGGRTAWIQALTAHLVMLNTWGLINSFGIFQTYYVSAFNQSPSNISWVGSIQIFLVFFIGTFTGRLTDGGYFHHVLLVGSVLQVLGLFMVSLCTSYWQLILAQGICTGVGSGFLFCPTLSLLSTYFDKRRSLALGIAAAGTATGGVIFPVMVQQLLPKVGFPWTIRAVGFVQLASLFAANCILKTRISPRKSGPLLELGAFKELPYLYFAIGTFFVFWGQYFAFYYVGLFARSIIGDSYAESINILLVMNGVGAIARIIPNYFADRFTGPLNIMMPITFGAGVILCGWIGVTSTAGLYAWVVMFGMTSAAAQGLIPPVISSLSSDMRKVGTRMGQAFTIISFAVLTGPPIAGALIQADDGSYLYAQLFAGCSILLGSMFLLSARIAKTGFVLHVRV